MYAVIYVTLVFMETKDKIEQILKNHFQITYLEIHDDSAKHAGHPEAVKSGGGHFGIFIVSNDFQYKTLIQRHRMINQVLEEEFKDAIHALALKTLTPEEHDRS